MPSLTRCVFVLLQFGQKLWDGLLLGLRDVAEVLAIQNQEERLQVRNQPSQNWGERRDARLSLASTGGMWKIRFISINESKSIHLDTNQWLRDKESDESILKINVFVYSDLTESFRSFIKFTKSDFLISLTPSRHGNPARDYKTIIDSFLFITLYLSLFFINKCQFF